MSFDISDRANQTLFTIYTKVYILHTLQNLCLDLLSVTQFYCHAEVKLFQCRKNSPNNQTSVMCLLPLKL